MDTRNRNRNRDREALEGSEGSPAATDGRRERWQAATRLAAEADAAIDQCLSEDSERYLGSNRQQGGQ
jgi:hypothetical protein